MMGLVGLWRLLLCVCLGFQMSLSLASENLSSVSEQWQQRVKFAVIVGVDEYRNTTPLEHAVNDARSLADSLALSGYEVLKLENYQADPDVVLDTLRRAATLIGNKEAREDATLIFAFSGHGFQQDGINYLAMGNADPNNLATTALSMQRVKSVMSNSRVGQSILFIDACRNSPTRSTGAVNNVFVPDIDAKGLAILYSTGAGQLSWEDSTLRQGVFSYYLGKALRGEAASESPWVTIDSLFGYVKRSVASHVFKKYNKEQIPYFAGERSGNFAVAFNNHDKKTPLAVSSQSPPDNKPASVVEGGWTRRLIVLGVVAAAVLALSGGGDSDEGNITVVVPTP